jgi:hypothetical protein
MGVLLSVVTASACAGEIKTLMRDMKHAMQGAMDSRTIPEMKGYVSVAGRVARITKTPLLLVNPQHA